MAGLRNYVLLWSALLVTWIKSASPLFHQTTLSPRAWFEGGAGVPFAPDGVARLVERIGSTRLRLRGGEDEEANDGQQRVASICRAPSRGGRGVAGLRGGCGPQQGGAVLNCGMSHCSHPSVQCAIPLNPRIQHSCKCVLLDFEPKLFLSS